MQKIPDIIYLSDVYNEIDELYHNGIKSAQTTYIDKLDEIFRFLRKNVIVFGGIANHGKSTFLNWLMMLQSMNNGTKWAIFSPESFPAELFYSDLMRMYLGKSIINGYKDKATLIELRKAKEFIGSHFFNLYPETESPTPKLIFERFKQVIKEHGVDGCIIDPFNQLDNDWRSEGRDDLYISKFLTMAKKFAQSNDIYQIIVTHPKTQQKNKGEQDYSIPDMYDFHGGSMWVNKVDDIVMVHRPEKTSNPDSNSVLIRSIKIKRQNICGRPGTIDMYYSSQKNRFYVDGLQEKNEISYVDTNISQLIKQPEIDINNDIPF